MKTRTRIAVYATLLALALSSGCGSSDTDKLLSDNPKTRQEAIAKLQGPALAQALDKLVALLDNSSRSDKAISALTEIGAPAVDPLVAVVIKRYEIPTFWRRDDLPARLAAIKTLGAIGDARAVLPMLRSGDFDTLDKMCMLSWGGCDHKRPDTYVTAQNDAIVAMGEPAARVILSDACCNSAASAMTPYYRYLLARIGQNGHIREILSALEEPRLSRDAAHILARTGAREAVPALSAMADSADVRYDAAFALACIGGELAEEALKRFEARNKADIQVAHEDYREVLGAKRALTARQADVYLFLHARYDVPALREMLLQSTDSSLYTTVRWMPHRK